MSNFWTHSDSAFIVHDCAKNTRIVIVSDDKTDTFMFSIYDKNRLVESWGMMTKDQTSRFYVETYINIVSDWIRIEDNFNCLSLPCNGIYNLNGQSVEIPTV